MIAEVQRTSGSIAENVGNHIGNFFGDNLSRLFVFPSFNDVARGIFYFENVADVFIGAPAGNRGVGVGVFDGANSTARTNRNRKPSASRVVGAITDVAKFMCDFETVLDSVNIEGFNSADVKGVA